jgi:hypothetical protein
MSSFRPPPTEVVDFKAKFAFIALGHTPDEEVV